MANEKRVVFGPDRNGIAVPAIAPQTDVAVGALASSTAKVTLPTNYAHVEIASTGSFYFAFGDSTVTATTASSLFTAGSKVYRVPDGATHFAFLEASAGDDALPVSVTGVL